MPIVTVWNNPNTGAVALAQLSDDPADGTPAEQIAHLGTLSPYEGFTCVNENFTGSVPETDASLWRWENNTITSLPAPPPEPSVNQVREVLSGLGMSQAQLDALFAAAARL